MTSKRRINIVFAGLLIVLTSLIFTIIYFGSKHLYETNQQKRLKEAKSTLNQISKVIEEALFSKIALTQSTASFVRNNPDIDKDNFVDYAKHLFQATQNEVIAIQLTKDSIISFNYPEIGNESTFGTNILTIEGDNEYVRNAYKNKLKMSVGPRILIQNKLGLVYREPIILEDSSLWGYSVMVLSIDSIMNRIQIINSNIEQLAFYSQKINSGKGGFFYGSKEIKVGEHISEKVNVPLDSWTIYFAPLLNTEDDQFLYNLILFVILGISLLIGSSIAYLFRSFLMTRRNNHLLNIKNETINNQLEEKSILIKEIHHRIKNHFQMLSSLNRIRYISSEDDRINQIIEDINSRVYSMASVYDQLSSTETNNLELEPYIQSLCENLSNSINGQLKIEVSCCKDELDIKRTITLGVILTELITNANKHAFADSLAPKIRVSLTLSDNIFTLRVLDNGSKIPANILSQNHESQGIELIKLISQQLEASIHIVTDGEWQGFELSFNK